MLRHSKIWIGLPLVLLLSGCGLFGGDKDFEEPAPLTEISGELQFEAVWRSRVGNGNGDKYVQFRPAISGDLLVLAEVNGRVVAMDRNTGARIWDTETRLDLTGGVGVGYGQAVVGSVEGEVVALSLADGSERWRAQVSSELLTPAEVGDDLVVVQSSDDNLHAFDAESGERRWVFDNTVPILTLRGTSRPLLLDDKVVAGFANGKVVALRKDGGQMLWEYRVGIPKGDSELERIVDIDGDLLLDGDVVIAASYQGRISAVQLETGVARWNRETSAYLGAGVGDVYVYLVNAKGQVYALDRSDAREVWNQDDLLYRRLTAPVTLNDSVLVGDYEGYLHALSADTGELKGRIQVDNSGLRSRPLVDGERVYVMANDGTVAAYTLN